MNKTNVVRPIHIVLWCLDIGLIAGVCYGLFWLLIWMGMDYGFAGPIMVVVFSGMIVIYKMMVERTLKMWRDQSGK